MGQYDTRLRPTPSSHTAPLLALVGLVMLLFAEAVFGGRVFFERDIQGYWHPQVATFVRTIAEGAWPLWDAYEGFGVPLLADPSSQVAYPTTWLNLLLLPATVYRVLVVIHAFWAAAGTYLLGRHAGLDPMPAAVAGGCWASSGPFLSLVSVHPHHFCGASWIPWVVLCAERLLDRPNVRAATWLGVTAAGQALAGSAEMCLFSALAVALRSLAWAISAAPHERWRAGGGLGLAGVLAAALAALQWLPTIVIMGAVGRGSFRAGENLYWSLHPFVFADAFVSRFMADVPLSPATRALLFESREPFLTSLYVGVPGLAAVALARGSRARQWAGLALFFGALSLGRHFPPAAALLTVFPLRLLRYPAKYVLPASLFFSLLVGCGIQAWRRPWQRPERRRAMAALLVAAAIAAASAAGQALAVTRPAELASAAGAHPEFLPWAAVLISRKLQWVAVVMAATAALLFVSLHRDRWRASAGLAFAMLASADFLMSGRKVNALASPELLRQPSPAFRYLTPEARTRRLLSEEADFSWLNERFTGGVAGWPREWSWALGLQDRLSPPLGARWGLRGSFDADYTGLASPLLPTMSSVVQSGAAPHFTVRMLRLGNVGTVVAVQRPFPGLEPLGEFRTVFDAPVRVLAVPDPLPAAYVAGGARVAANPMEVLRVLGLPDFQPALEVVLDARARPREVPEGFRATAMLRQRKADHLVVDVACSHDAYLVVVEAYHGGWSATVNGRASEVLPANGLFRAVPVPAGEHRVELIYRPWSVFAGAALTAVGAGVAGVVFARRSRAR